LREDDETLSGTPFRRLRKRAEFQRVSRGRRRSSPAFTLQSSRRAPETEPAAPGLAGLGFTVTKKVGNAVVRNRIRRRLKAAIAEARRLEAKADHDYVLVARREALKQGFGVLISDLRSAFGALAGGDRDGRKPGRPKTDTFGSETSPLPGDRSRRERPQGEDRP
jgi:ribonuclease P protein component